MNSAGGYPPGDTRSPPLRQGPFPPTATSHHALSTDRFSAPRSNSLTDISYHAILTIRYVTSRLFNNPLLRITPISNHRFVLKSINPAFQLPKCNHVSPIFSYLNPFSFIIRMTNCAKFLAFLW